MSEINYYEYKLYDSIYGNIWMSEYEYRVVNTPLFHRLHRIRQMGWNYSIFPSAVHTRFSHSLGVLFILSKMLSDLSKSSKSIEEPNLAELRMAALLHDVGHMPISHIGESATKNAVIEQKGNKIDLTRDTKNSAGVVKLHEDLSSIIVRNDSDLDKIFEDLREKKYQYFDKDNVAQIILGAKNDLEYSVLLNSELDADRLDYLIRDSEFTGVNYGKVEIDYIISNLINVRLKENGIEKYVIAVDSNAVHGIEHYIIARFFQYIQVLKSPKIYLMDYLAQEVFKYMIEDQEIPVYSREEIYKLVESNDPEDKHRFYKYTDDYIFLEMRKLHEKLDKKIKRKRSRANEDDKFINDAIKIIMDGDIPEPLLVRRELCNGYNIICQSCRHENPESAKFCMECGSELNPLSIIQPKTERLATLLSSKRNDIAKAFNINEKRIIISNPEPLDKIGKYFLDKDSKDQRSKSIKLLLDTKDIEVDYLSNRKYTLIGQLTGYESRAIYLFLILPKTDSVSWRDSHDKNKQILKDLIREDLSKIFNDKVHEDFQIYDFNS